jgi:hypothetical protein
MLDPINLMLWYWGRRGFPVRLTDDLIRRLVNRDDVKLTVSLSRQSEGFTTRGAVNASGFYVDTFQSAASMPAALLRLPSQRRALVQFAQANKVEVVFALMRHPFSPWVLPVLRRAKQRVLLAVHDALPHPGDWFPLWLQHFRLDLTATDGSCNTRASIFYPKLMLSCRTAFPCHYGSSVRETSTPWLR